MLVDDHVIFRDGLKILLNDLPNYEVIAEADNGKDALQILKVLEVDILISDISMPEMDGFQLTKAVVESYPKIKIVVLTMHSDFANLEIMEEIGVHGFMSKTTSSRELLEILDAVQQNSECLKISVPDHSGDETKNPFEITKREREILILIAQGFTDKEIAEKIKLSPYTVITHRKNLLSKLNLKNKVELTRFAIENGYLNS